MVAYVDMSRLYILYVCALNEFTWSLIQFNLSGFHRLRRKRYREIVNIKSIICQA